MTVPGRNTAAAPISRSVAYVAGRDHAADHDHDVVAAERRPAPRFSAGSRVRWPAASELTPTMCTSASTACWATSSGRGEQRAHVDVEAHVGEGGDDHLLAAVVAVLAHLGDQDARAPALGLLELLGRGEHLLDQCVAVGAGLVA